MKKCGNCGSGYVLRVPLIEMREVHGMTAKIPVQVGNKDYCGICDSRNIESDSLEVLLG